MHPTAPFYLLISTIAHGGIALAYALAMFRAQDEHPANTLDEKLKKRRRLNRRHIYGFICFVYLGLFSLEALQCQGALSSCAMQTTETTKNVSGEAHTSAVLTCVVGSG